MNEVYQCQNCGRDVSQLGIAYLQRWVHNHSQSERCDAPPVAVPQQLDFDGWLAYGISNGYCSEQVCANHAGIPMVDDEMDSENPDFCIHVVRLGNEDDWQREIDGFNQLATEG